MNFNLSVTINSIGSTEQITDNLNKREVRVTTNEQYPQELCVEAYNANCELFNDVRQNDVVRIYFNIAGRTYTARNDKTYNNISLKVWKLEIIKKASGEPVAQVADIPE